MRQSCPHAPSDAIMRGHKRYPAILLAVQIRPAEGKKAGKIGNILLESFDILRPNSSRQVIADLCHEVHLAQ
jgi:hypothetical protein